MRNAALLLLLLSPLAAASDRLERFLAPHVEAWEAIEQVVADANAAPPGAALGVFPGEYGTLHLGRDGKAALVSGDDEDPAQRVGMIGTVSVEGPWVLLTLSQLSFSPESFRSADPDELEAMLDAWEQEEEDAALAEAEGAESAEDPEHAFASRLLAVAHAGGWLLLDADNLAGIARRWDGETPLALEPSFWSASLDDPADPPSEDHGSVRFAVADPLAADLPWPLKRMLHRETIDARIVEILDAPADLQWQQQSSALRVRIDRGSMHGVYEEMLLFGLADQQGKQLMVTSVAADHAVATLQLSRFHPSDPVELPALGTSWISRTVEGGSCPLDFSAAVRAKVQATPAEPVFDEEGYAWIVLQIDQGAAHGLAAGDRLYAEDYAFDGEGRVATVRPNEAEVLWRIVRYMPEMKMTPPTVGTALVTPAWRRAAFDLFGSTPLPSGEPIEVIVD